MNFALLYEHKVNTGTRGIINVFATEPEAMTEAGNQAQAHPEFNYYVCPMQTQVSGTIQVVTKVIAPNPVTPPKPVV